MEYYLGVAEGQGLTSSELDAVKAIVMSVSACRARSQLGEVVRRRGADLQGGRASG
jgi:hypothetical protein